MRSAAAAIAYSKAHPTIPYDSLSSLDSDYRTVSDLECARSVMADYDIMPISDMGTANRMWERTAWKRSDTPFHGAPLYFPNARAGSSGHIAEYDALSGLAWTTPIYGPNLPIKDAYQGKHSVAIPELARLCGNSYAGWGMDIAGVPIDFTPITERTIMTQFAPYHTTDDLAAEIHIRCADGTILYIAKLQIGSLTLTATQQDTLLLRSDRGEGPFTVAESSFLQYWEAQKWAVETASLVKSLGKAGAAPQIDYTKIILPGAKEIAALVKMPTEKSIAAEVIRQQKLSGN